MVLFLWACVQFTEPLVENGAFEEEWWQPTLKEICFNFHGPDNLRDYNQLLIYEDGSLTSWGEWEFEHPNTYIIDKKDVIIEKNNECWTISGTIYGVNYDDIACECILDVDDYL
jgi:hypothetical protein|tara:strand:+ start:19 stop:360 length:342 start_codon:yes stop_codon:yes gene_type:complete